MELAGNGFLGRCSARSSLTADKFQPVSTLFQSKHGIRLSAGTLLEGKGRLASHVSVMLMEELELWDHRERSGQFPARTSVMIQVLATNSELDRTDIMEQSFSWETFHSYWKILTP